MTQSVAILGRQPALGIAELESLFGPEKMISISDQAVLVEAETSAIAFSRLGGSIKLGKVLSVQNTTDWSDLQLWLKHTISQHLQAMPAEGKLQLGMSAYGLNVSTAKLNASGLELKKAIRAIGRSIRLIPNKTPELNSAQVLHNHLTGPLGLEFLFIRSGDRTYVAQTTHVQDINAYAARDQARPKRDARVGMLPPKLAQIIINLAVAQQTADNKHQTVLDPFCGTGVIPQESLLMGYEAYGTDLEPRMIEYSQTNLAWLGSGYHLPSNVFSLEQADATSYTWQPFNTIACETYLGRPFSALPKPDMLQTVVQDVDTIHRKFLKNVARQTRPGFGMCLAVPAWKIPTGFKHLPILDHLTDLGYTRNSFVHAGNRDLIYHRPEQIVGRELVILIRK